MSASPSRARGYFVGLVAVAWVVAGCSTNKLETSDTTTVSSTTTSSASSGGATSTSSSTSTASTTTTSSDVDPWTLNAGQYRGQDGLRVSVDCTPNGQPYSVWGTGTYTDDSSICTAAVHAGLITFAEGGSVRIEIAPGLQSYEGSEANGVTSSSYGPWGGSYVFVSE